MGNVVGWIVAAFLALVFFGVDVGLFDFLSANTPAV